MTAAEFTDIQRALVYIFAPWVQVLLAFLLGASIMTAFTFMFVRLARFLTGLGD
jgi:hypothetical protein